MRSSPGWDLNLQTPDYKSTTQPLAAKAEKTLVQSSPGRDLNLQTPDYKSTTQPLAAKKTLHGYAVKTRFTSLLVGSFILDLVLTQNPTSLTVLLESTGSLEFWFLPQLWTILANNFSQWAVNQFFVNYTHRLENYVHRLFMHCDEMNWQSNRRQINIFLISEHSPGINGEGELRGQPANPGSPGKMAVNTECVCQFQNVE